MYLVLAVGENGKWTPYQKISGCPELLVEDKGGGREDEGYRTKGGRKVGSVLVDK